MKLLKLFIRFYNNVYVFLFPPFLVSCFILLAPPTGFLLMIISFLGILFPRNDLAVRYYLHSHTGVPLQTSSSLLFLSLKSRFPLASSSLLFLSLLPRYLVSSYRLHTLSYSFRMYLVSQGFFFFFIPLPVRMFGLFFYKSLGSPIFPLDLHPWRTVSSGCFVYWT